MLGDAPSIPLTDFQDISNRIVPGHDASGAITPGTETGFVMGGPSSGGAGVIRVNSPEELEQQLWNAQQNGKMPVVLMVDARAL